MRKAIIITIGIILLLAAAVGGYYYGKPKTITGATKLKAELTVNQWKELFGRINYQVSKLDSVKNRPQQDTILGLLNLLGSHIDSVNHLK